MGKNPLPRILHLTPAEERVYLRRWAKTYAVGQATCRATFEDLARAARLSWSTTKTALVKLEGRGLIEIARCHKAPCVFLVHCTALSPSDQPVELGTSQTLNLLTAADREMLLDVKRSLSPAKILHYKEIARQKGAELDEEILFATFGPERLKGYRAFFPHRP